MLKSFDTRKRRIHLPYLSQLFDANGALVDGRLATQANSAAVLAALRRRIARKGNGGNENSVERQHGCRLFR